MTQSDRAYRCIVTVFDIRSDSIGLYRILVDKHGMAKACSSSANISLQYLCHISIFTYHLLEMPTRIFKKKNVVKVDLSRLQDRRRLNYRTSVNRF